ncbi:hypothetical protein [Clostridium sp. AM58-1XD]|uniref:hypothetical protein n=1 Tax=Clostridium sp. AM58-1XD TaxID=2292307 RepID=UPI000E4780A6|nr:hypothetical protein [Clostridium sp. AM58-1XD]RGY97693.1 hypothetical protein DXA13_13435 [Clostridium sp. AM58-1XD]
MTPISDHIAFLTEAREKLEELELLKDREKQLKADEIRLEKVLESEKKTVNDNIAATIKKRREEINSSYDKEIAKGQDKLKKARVKREKAKSQGMKERIAEETADLHKENRDLKLQMKTMFQKNHVPAVCNSSLYYAMFFPRWFGEILKLLIAVLICFLAVPYGIYLALPEKKTWMMVVICFLCVVIFGGLYIWISNRTKLLHMEVLRTGRTLRDQMHSNRKKIRVITSSIKKDRNEALYDLEKYDDEIARVEQELQDVANKKKEALNTFEQVTKMIISDEIANNARPRVDKLREEFQQVTAGTKELEGQIKDMTLFITDHYGTYLGNEFLNPLKIGELSEIIKSGKASI